MKRRTVTEHVGVLDEFRRRLRIIDEHYLRQEISREEKLRRESPDVWRDFEASRAERNRVKSELNRRLREAGCRPVAPEPSLTQKVKKLPNKTRSAHSSHRD